MQNAQQDKLLIRDMVIKITQRRSTLHPQGWLSSRRQMLTNADENVEKLETSYITAEVQNSEVIMENNFIVS